MEGPHCLKADTKRVVKNDEWTKTRRKKSDVGIIMTGAGFWNDL